MKSTVKRMLALVLALLLAVPSFAFAEEPVIQSELVDEIIDSTELDFIGDDENPGFDVEFTDVDGDTVIDDGEDIDLSDEDEDMPSDDGDFLEDDDISIDDTDDSASGTGVDASGTDPEMIGEDVDSSDGEEAVTPMDAEAEEPAPADTPAEGGETPVEDDAVPADADTPAEGGEASVENDTVPADADTPAEGGEASVENDTVPADVDTPTEGGEVSAESDSAPAEDDAAPAEDDMSGEDDIPSGEENEGVYYAVEAVGLIETATAAEAMGALFEGETAKIYGFSTSTTFAPSDDPEKTITPKYYVGDGEVGGAQAGSTVTVKLVKGSKVIITDVSAVYAESEDKVFGPNAEATTLPLTKVDDLNYTLVMPEGYVGINIVGYIEGETQSDSGSSLPGGLVGPPISITDDEHTPHSINYPSSGVGFNAAVGCYGHSNIVSSAVVGTVLTLYLSGRSGRITITAGDESIPYAYNNDKGGYDFTMLDKDVEISIEPADSGSSDPSGEPEPVEGGEHTIHFAFAGEYASYGKIIAYKNGTSVKSADAGSEIQVTAYGTANGFYCSQLTLTSGTEVTTLQGSENGPPSFIMPGNEVTLTATIAQSGSGNGGQGSEPRHFTTGAHKVTVSKSAHGSIQVTTEGMIADTANAGSWLDFDVNAENGYVISGITATYGGVTRAAKKQYYSYDGSWKYEFTMPDADVTFQATFVEAGGNAINIDSGIVNGNVYASLNKAVAGTTVTVCGVPDDDYDLDTITVTGPNGSSVIVTDNTFTMPDGAVTVSATFVSSDTVAHGIEIHIQGEGTVSADQTSNIRSGTTVTLTVTPDDGYKLQSLYAYDRYDEEVTVTENNTFIMPACNVTVEASFVTVDTHTINYQPNLEHGSIYGPETAKKGDEVTLTIWPETGYKLGELTVIGPNDSSVTVTDNTFTMPEGDVTVSATFVEESVPATRYSIGINDSIANGSVTAKVNGVAVTTAAKDDEVTLVVTPNEGYELAQDGLHVYQNGDEVPLTNNNTFTMPDGDVTVAVSFSAISYDVTVKDPENGSVSCSPTSFSFGDKVEFSLTPAEHYELDTLTVSKDSGGMIPCDGDGEGGYSFTMPASNVTITATFKAIKYSVTIDSSLQNGTLTVDKTTAAYGETVTLTATPADGYELAEDPYRFSIDGETGSGSLGPSNGNKLTMPAGNVTVSVIFVKKNYKIHYGDMEYGSVGAKLNGESANYVTWGETLTLIVEPDPGYELDTMAVTDSNGKEVTVTDNSFTMPKKEVTISATFRPIDYAINVSPVTNGSVIAQQNGVQVETAHYLETVYLNVTPADGYELESLTVTGLDGDVPCDETYGVYQFTMPAGNVTVSAVFVLESSQGGPSGPRPDGAYDIQNHTLGPDLVFGENSYTIQAYVNEEPVNYAVPGTRVEIRIVKGSQVNFNGIKAYSCQSLDGDPAQGTELELTKLNDTTYTVNMPEGILRFSPSYDGGSGGPGDPSVDSYALNGGTSGNFNMGDMSNAVKFLVEGQEVSRAKEGEEVTVQINARWYPVQLVCKYAEGTQYLDLESPTFTMPASDVFVTAWLSQQPPHTGAYKFIYNDSHGCTIIAYVRGGVGDAISANANEYVNLNVYPPQEWIYEGACVVTYGDTTLNLSNYQGFTMPAQDVTITPILSPAHTGQYRIEVKGGSQGGGNAYVNNVRATSADVGEKVELRINANPGYKVTGATLTYNGQTQKLTADNMTFTMPAGNVEVTPEFASDGIIVNDANFPDKNLQDILKQQQFAGHMEGSDFVLSAGMISYLEVNNVKDFTGLDQLTKLNRLVISGNEITTLTLNHKTVTSVMLGNCENLTSVVLSGCPNLIDLNFEGDTGKVSNLDVSGCTKLTSLLARGAALTTLDVSKNTELVTLNCNSNQLTELDVSQNTKLESLCCFSNNITQLNLVKNSRLLEYITEENKRDIDDTQEGYTCVAYVNPETEEWVLAHDPGVQVSLAPMFDIVKAYADEGEPRGTIEAPSAAPAGRTVTVTVVPNEGYALQGIEVTDDTGAIQITDVSEGVYTFTMPEGEVTITARFIPTLVITAPEAIPDLVYNGQAQALVTAAKTNGGTLQYSLDGENWGETIPTGTDVGSYNVYYQVIDSDGYYGDGTGAEPVAVEIARKPVNVTAANQSKTYGETDPELTYTADGLIGTDKLTGLLGREEGEDAGEYAITQGTLSAGNNYEIILNDATLTITPKALTVTAEDKTKTYGEDDPELTWTTEDLVGEDKLTGNLTRAAGENVGDYAITQGTLAATDNYEMSFDPGRLTITKKALTVTAEDKTKVYGEDDPELTWTTQDLVGDDTLTGALTRVEGEDVKEGGYAIERGTLAATANYDMTFVPGTLTINKKALTVTAMPRTKVYGESDPKLTYTVTGLVGDDKVSGELERVAGENVQEGGYAIGQGSLTAGGNYDIAYTGSTLTITPAALTVTPDALSKTYGDDDPEVLSYTAVGLANDDTKDTALSGKLERATGDNAGEYAIAQGTLAATANYNLTFTEGVKFTIRPKKVTAVAKATSKTYGEKDPVLTYSVADGQLVGSDTQAEVLTGSLTRAAGENVGSYAITKGTLKSASDNYELVFQTTRLTINKKELAVTAEDKTKTYGDADPTLTWTAPDLVEGDALTGALTRAEGEDVGEYAITQGTLDAGDNYTMVFNPGKLTVNQRKLTVTPDAVEKTYGETDPALTYTVAGELVGADALTGALERAEGETAGTYAIARGTLSAGDNYDIELDAAALTINKRPLTITIDAKAKLLDADDPDLTYTVTGLAAGDEATIELVRAEGEEVGAYPISLESCAIKKDADDVTASYDVTYNHDAKLTIGDNVINVTAEAAVKTYGAKDPELEYEATIPEGGALTGALGRVQGEDAGTYAITQGTLQPNAGYVLNFVGANLTIEKAALTVTPDDAEKTYGEADPELTYAVDGLVNGDAAEAVLTGALARDTGEDVKDGGYAITQGTLAANNNYTLTVATGKALTIAAKALNVTAKDAEKTYGDADPAFDYDVDGLVNGDTKEAVLTGTLARDEGVDVNEAGYAITQGTLQSRSDNYTVDTFVPAKLVINKKDITVKVTSPAESGLSKAYGDNDPAFEYVDTEGKLVGSDTLTISREAGEKVGVYAFTADNANYNVAFKDGESEQRFEITPKTLTSLTWFTEGLVYNGSGLKPTASVIGNDLEEGDTCYVNVNAIEINGQDGKATVIDAVDAGDYTAEAASLTNPNYTLPDDTGITRSTFAISKAPGEAQTVAREVTVSFHGVKDGRVDLTNYLKDATAWSVKSSDALITAAAPEGNALVYSTMDTEGTEISTGSVVINVQSKNYDDSTLTVNFRTSTAFALRFESNGGPQEASRSLAAGDKIKDYLPAAAERDGYELKGWYLDAALTDPVSEYNAMGESDATVYAKWAPITYTIQLTDPDGYHSAEDNLNPITYTVATDPSTPSLTLPILKDNKSGSLSFTFIGWKELGEAEDVEPRLDVTIDPASMVNTTYVAQWKQGEVAGKVAFENAGGGSGLQGVQGLDSKNEASTDDDAPTTSLANAMKAIANENMTEETADSKITVEMNISASSKDAEAKAAIKEAVAPPQAEGVTQSTDFMEITITSETTMAAEEPTEAPVVLDQRTVSDAGRVVEIPLKYDMTGRYNPVITRHHRDENGTSVTPLRRLTRRPSGSEMKDGTFYIEGSGANATVYVYSQLFSTLGMTYDDSGELQVYFDYNNGTAPQEVVVRENEKLQRPEEDPVREGNETYAYVFDKWYADPACKTPYNFDAPVTRNNMTVYAGWKRYAIVDVTVEGFNGKYDKAEHNVTVKIENDNPDIDVYFGEAELTKENYKDGSMTVQSETMPTEKTYHWYAEATDCVANPASGVVTINVQKLPSAVTTAPRAQSLTYNGGAQALVSAGKATGGTLKYALGTSGSSAPASGWSASVPTAVNAGTYYVWYKVEGTSVYADVKPACVTVTVSAPAAQAAPQAATPQPEPIPTIPVLKKSVKKTISAAPGSVYQIELGGKTGKSFKSSKKKVATVSATGLITVKAAGKTKITLKVGKKKRTLILKVKDPTVPTRIALNAPGGTAVKVGESQTLTVTLPEGTNSGIKWKSSNKKIATVNAQGVVTFKKAGKVTITATAVRGKKKAKVKFKVSK